MNLKQLLYFYQVAKTGNYSRAAEELGVSEPVINRAIKSLERDYGVRLLERSGKRICLTAPGRAIFDSAAQMASLADLTEQTLLDHKRLISGKISIGAASTVASYILPDILSEWMAAHPGVDIFLIQERTKDLEKLLVEDRLDIVFSSAKRWVTGLRSRLIFSDRLVVVAAPNHPAVQRGPLSILDLSQQRLLAHPKGTSIRDQLDEVEYEYGVQFRPAVEATQDYAIKQLCIAGVGVAILPMLSVRAQVENQNLCVLDIEGFPRNRPYFEVHRSDRTLTREVHSLLSAVQLWLANKQKRLADVAEVKS